MALLSFPCTVLSLKQSKEPTQVHYSPDLNPIEEEALSKVKHLLRKKTCARTKEALIEAMGRALAAVSTEDVRGFFSHCGYRTPAQLL